MIPDMSTVIIANFDIIEKKIDIYGVFYSS